MKFIQTTTTTTLLVISAQAWQGPLNRRKVTTGPHRYRNSAIEHSGSVIGQFQSDSMNVPPLTTTAPLHEEALLADTLNMDVVSSEADSGTNAGNFNAEIDSLGESAPAAPALEDLAPSKQPDRRWTIQRELRMTAGMMQSNVPTSVMLGFASTIAFGLARSAPLSAAQWIATLTKSIVWFFAYGYSFDIGNQITGVEEDRLNLGDLACKANRPLATGEMSMRGGYVRQIISSTVFASISIIMGGMPLVKCALLWIGSSIGYNYLGLGDHFATKNYVVMSNGCVASLLAARIFAGEATTSVLPPILAAFWAGISLDCQDFRDEVGDRLSGRRTTAVLWGLRRARRVWMGTVGLSTVGLGAVLRRCLSWPDAIIAASAVALAVRTQFNKTPREDHKTYNGICFLGFAIFCRSPFWAQLF